MNRLLLLLLACLSAGAIAAQPVAEAAKVEKALDALYVHPDWARRLPRCAGGDEACLALSLSTFLKAQRPIATAPVQKCLGAAAADVAKLCSPTALATDLPPIRGAIETLDNDLKAELRSSIRNRADQLLDRSEQCGEARDCVQRLRDALAETGSADPIAHRCASQRGCNIDRMNTGDLVALDKVLAFSPPPSAPEQGNYGWLVLIVLAVAAMAAVIVWWRGLERLLRKLAARRPRTGDRAILMGTLPDDPAGARIDHDSSQGSTEASVRDDRPEPAATVDDAGEDGSRKSAESSTAGSADDKLDEQIADIQQQLTAIAGMLQVLNQHRISSEQDPGDLPMSGSSYALHQRAIHLPAGREPALDEPPAEFLRKLLDERDGAMNARFEAVEQRLETITRLLRDTLEAIQGIGGRPGPDGDNGAGATGDGAAAFRATFPPESTAAPPAGEPDADSGDAAAAAGEPSDPAPLAWPVRARQWQVEERAGVPLESAPRESQSTPDRPGSRVSPPPVESFFNALRRRQSALAERLHEEYEREVERLAGTSTRDHILAVFQAAHTLAAKNKAGFDQLTLFESLVEDAGEHIGLKYYSPAPSVGARLDAVYGVNGDRGVTQVVSRVFSPALLAENKRVLVQAVVEWAKG